MDTLVAVIKVIVVVVVVVMVVAVVVGSHGGTANIAAAILEGRLSNTHLLLLSLLLL